MIGTHGRLLASDCTVVEVHATTDKRKKAVEHALSLEWPPGGPSGVQVGAAEKVRQLLWSFSPLRQKHHL